MDNIQYIISAVVIAAGVVVWLAITLIKKSKEKDVKEKFKKIKVEDVIVLTKDNKEKWMFLLKKQNHLFLEPYNNFLEHPWYKDFFYDEANILINYENNGFIKEVDEIWQLRKKSLKLFKFEKDYQNYYSIFEEEKMDLEKEIEVKIKELQKNKIDKLIKLEKKQILETVEIPKDLNPYEVLGVDPSMPFKKIEEVYFQLAKIYKDDLNKKANDKYQQLEWAIETIEKEKQRTDKK
ncbi:hypothetical protein SHELI_v1c07400 [Spiroplasma helicoides]|uniref:J domain-containing protein n=1 Tax=Spiroplasma helicoides TaxID=216938 RepID=A0A1B3SL83_9MOLU|nr:DnaJ domain-containing protein [Spiroplasma helicoides]AOG60689.1 hypothetical protein SHELI_v1c07400 [Spiroplasma helicoides]